jgi:hypothetical protein
MGDGGTLIVIADTSVLVNFLRIDAMTLLGRVSRSIVITEHVQVEVTEDYADQRDRLAAALADGQVAQVALTSEGELAVFGSLLGDGRLGSGECAAIACAIAGGHALAIHDRRAGNEALRVDANLPILRTQDLVLMMIKEQILTIAQADAMKETWEREHRFRLAFASFGDILD